uniref:Uncharacterized protein n=1 Tax=Romanomermis culicivorax TaxID=13658 RepID=A0A915HWE7_ROMCU
MEARVERETVEALNAFKIWFANEVNPWCKIHNLFCFSRSYNIPRQFPDDKVQLLLCDYAYAHLRFYANGWNCERLEGQGRCQHPY